MKILFKVLSLIILVLVASCSGSDPVKEEKGLALEVFKSPDCGCCGIWVTHIEERGFNPIVRNKDALDGIKKKYNIPADVQSCHTGVSAEGYFFEGHIPAKFIKAFLSSPPDDAVGLAVPGMPAGSPGMEMGDRFSPYSIILVKSDGSKEVFAQVSSAEEQF